MPDEKGRNRSTAGDAYDSAISRAVEIGYKVIEEQIQQGQKIAEQFASGGIDRSLMNGNAADIGERVVRFYSDMGALWFEMVESVMRNPAVGDLYKNVGGAMNGHENGAAKSNGVAASQSNGWSAMPVEIISPEATGARVSIELHSECETSRLLAQPLVAAGADKPPILGVEIAPPEDQWSAAIRVKIPAGQPPGTYSGLLLNAATEEPVGTVCLSIPAPGSAPEG